MDLALHRLARLRILWVVHLGFLPLYGAAGARLAPGWVAPADHTVRLVVVAVLLAVLCQGLLRLRGPYGPRLLGAWIAAEGSVVCGVIHWIEGGTPYSFALGAAATGALLFTARPRLEPVRAEVARAG